MPVAAVTLGRTVGAPAANPAVVVDSAPKNSNAPDYEAILETLQQWKRYEQLAPLQRVVAAQSLTHACSAYRRLHEGDEPGTPSIRCVTDGNEGMNFIVVVHGWEESSFVDHPGHFVGPLDQAPQDLLANYLQPIPFDGLTFIERCARAWSVDHVGELLDTALADDREVDPTLYESLRLAALKCREMTLENGPLTARIVTAEDADGQHFGFLEVLEASVEEPRIVDPFRNFNGPLSTAAAEYPDRFYNDGRADIVTLRLERLAVADLFPIPRPESLAAEGSSTLAVSQLAVSAYFDISRCRIALRQTLDGIDPPTCSPNPLRELATRILELEGWLGSLCREADIVLSDHLRGKTGAWAATAERCQLVLRRLFFDKFGNAVLSSVRDLATEAAASLEDAQKPRARPPGEEGKPWWETVPAIVQYLREAADGLDGALVTALYVGSSLGIEGLPDAVSRDVASSVLRLAAYRHPACTVASLGLEDEKEFRIGLLMELLEVVERQPPMDLGYTLVGVDNTAGSTRVVESRIQPELQALNPEAPVIHAMEIGLQELTLAIECCGWAAQKFAAKDLDRAGYELAGLHHHLTRFDRISASLAVVLSRDGSGKLGSATHSHDVGNKNAEIRSTVANLIGRLEEAHSTDTRRKILADLRMVENACCLLEAAFRVTGYLGGADAAILEMSLSRRQDAISFIRDYYDLMHFSFYDLDADVWGAELPFVALQLCTNNRRYGGGHGHLLIGKFNNTLVVVCQDDGPGYVDPKTLLPVSSELIGQSYHGRSSRTGGGSGNQFIEALADRGIRVASRTAGYDPVYWQSQPGLDPLDYPNRKLHGVTQEISLSLLQDRPRVYNPFRLS